MTSQDAPTKNPHSAVDETTPLIAVSTAGPTAQPNEEPLLHQSHTEDEDDTPLPKVQVFLLCYARLVEPIAFFSIFPFINQMIYETGELGEADVGFYSGLIESLFSLTQMLLMISWGRAADRLGRKPVLVFSLCGVAVATSLFGLSKTIWQMIIFRCFAGVFAGTIVTVRTMITENITPRTQARAFSFFAFASNLGIFLGPLIGGGLSKPADQFPKIFGKIAFFNEYPYALPTFAVGVLGASAALVSALFINETLKRKDKDSTSTTAPLMSTIEIFKSDGVAPVLFIYSHVMVLALGYTAVIPVFWFTAPSLGGFGFTPKQISVFLGAGGLSQALWLLLAFPPLQLRFGTGGVLRTCSVLWPMMLVFPPLCNFFLRQGWNLTFWIVAPTALVFGSSVSMAFTAVQLALNDISPSHATLGTLNALALTLVCGIRAIAPAFFASIFATGARTQIFAGYLAWVVLFVIACGLAVSLRWLPAKAEGKVKPKRREREE